ncbi:MAG: serine/threonine-protein kinase [Holophagaceae bacterium]
MNDAQKLPEAIGRYEVRKLLGAGAMGSVWLAEDPRIKRKVAIKTVKLDALRSEADRHEFMMRFQREAEISGLLNHPGIVAIYDFGESDLGPFLAMEYVAGQPLDGLMKSGASMPLRDKLRIAAGIAEALDHAHHHGIVHRDVKPGNVMITEDGRPKLMDFGIAKREDANLTQTGTFLGTPSYASPEQIREGTVDNRSDIFSFGVLVFELLSGMSPFPGNSINTILYRIVNEPPVEVKPPVLGVLPDGWGRIFSRVLAKKPADRYESCALFVKDLMESATDLHIEEKRELLGILKMGTQVVAAPIVNVAGQQTVYTPHATQPPRSRGKAGLVAGGAAAVLALAAGGWFLLSRGGDRLLIATQPPKADVYVDGEKVGATDTVPIAFRAGAKVKIEARGFEPFERTLKAPTDLPKSILLKEIVKPVTLKSDPSGATVLLNGELKGTTPLTLDWKHGHDYKLTLTKGEGLAFTRDFKAGESPDGEVFKLVDASTASAVDPTAAGVLKVAGAFPVRVRIDGADKGELGPKGQPLPPGTYKVELSNPKVFYRETRSVTVKPGQTATVGTPAMGSILVETFPGVGTVSVDGVSTGVESDGSTPIKVSRGSHVVSVKGAKQAVEVGGENQKVKFKI